MARTASKIAFVAILFAGSLVLQVLFYPASRSPLLTVLYIGPVTLAALFWGMIPGLLVGLAATAPIVALEAVVNPILLPTVAALGTIFYAGLGALIGHMSDLTRADRRRAASLDAARARLSSVLSAAKDAVITIDPEGRVTSWNAAAERMFGWSEAEALGRDLHALIPGPMHRGGAGPQAPAFPRPDEARYLHTTVEMEGVRRDGSVFPVELSLASFMQEGRRHAVGIVRDTSERQESEARFRRLFENVPVGLYRTGVAGQILEVNQAMVDLLGFPDRETLLARNAASLYVEPGEREGIIRRAGREPSIHCETRLLAYDGSLRTCLMSVRAERGPDGQVIGFEGSMRDVTEMRRLEALHRQVERLEAVDALAAGVAHDFSNILAGIRGFAEHLASAADSSVGGIGRRIVDAVDRADRITTDLMTILGGQTREVRQIDLYEICRAAIDGRGPRAAGTVELVTPDEVVGVIVDPDMVASAIRELVENAVQASPAGAPVVVRTGSSPETVAAVLGPASGRPGPWAWISVADRGTGMDEVTRVRIFEPYFTTKPFGSGAGLGLVRALGIIRQHGGGIGVESEPGRGTTMTIYLPLASVT
jgi:two-component system cell cycle sensor histidine kinase/response regulator CckA